MVKYRTRGRNRMVGGGSLYRLYSAYRSGQNAARSTRLNMARSRTATATMSKTRGSSGVGITVQRDRKLVYRKKVMPKWKKRPWRKFTKKVLAVAEKDFGSQTVLFNKLVQGSNLDGNNQLVVDVALYPNRSTVSQFNDLKQISDYNQLAATTVATGLDIDKTTQVIFQSAILDITVRNACTVKFGEEYTPTSQIKLEVDVYEISVGRSDDIGVTYNSLRELLATNFGNQQQIGGGTIGTLTCDIFKRGVTPWECTYALSQYKIKIWKKTKFTIAGNEQFTYQVRDPRRHVVTQNKIAQTEGLHYPGLTKFILFIAKAQPGYIIGDTDGTYQERLDIGCTRKYMYKISNYSEDRSIYANL